MKLIFYIKLFFIESFDNIFKIFLKYTHNKKIQLKSTFFNQFNDMINKKSNFISNKI